jgi:hypothetical protein
MSEPSNYDIIRAMQMFGGSFASNLAKAARHADEENLARIKETWPEYWEQYKQLAIRMKEEGK